MSTATQTTPPASARRVPNLVSVREAAARLPVIPEPSFRDLIYHAEPRLAADGEVIPPNGFAPCIVRLNRRVLIDFDAVLDWIETNRQSHRAPRRAA